MFVPGFKTGVITNNWIDDTSGHTNQLMNQFLSEHFDVVLQSCQLGIRKPNPLIYRLACQRLGISPSEVGYGSCRVKWYTSVTLSIMGESVSELGPNTYVESPLNCDELALYLHVAHGWFACILTTYRTYTHTYT